MSTELWLDYLGILLDSHKADGLAFVINLVIPDQGERYVLEMSNATLTNIKGVQAARPDLTVTINRSRSRADHDAAGDVRVAGGGRQGQAGWQRAGAAATDGLPHAVRSCLRDHAGNEAICHAR